MKRDYHVRMKLVDTLSVIEPMLTLPGGQVHSRRCLEGPDNNSSKLCRTCCVDITL